MFLTYNITESDNEKTVLHILLSRMKLSRKLIISLKKLDNGILLNESRVFTNAIVHSGDVLSANISSSKNSVNIEPQNLPLNILFEDEYLLIINKTSNQVIHPTYNHPNNTLANAVAFYYTQKDIHTKIRPVSRLDRDTSGIVVFAKNSFAQEKLSAKNSELRFSKYYLALVHNTFQPLNGTIDMPIERVPGSTIERQVSFENTSDSARAITHYETIEKYVFQNCEYSLVLFKLETGRTHQIRVHCKYSGHPIVGDTLYFVKNDHDSLEMARQALHSHKLIFTHPITLKTIEIISELPSDMKNALQLLSTSTQQ